MDQNLTGIVALNTTLIEPWWKSLLTILGGALSAAIGAIAVYWPNKEAERNKELKEKHNKKVQAYRQLRGKKIFLEGLYKSYGYTHYECVDANNAFEKKMRPGTTYAEAIAEDMLDLQEQTETIRSHEEFRKNYHELLKGRSDLWMLIGSIEMLFPASENLSDKISKVEVAEEKFFCALLEVQDELPKVRGPILEESLIKDIRPAFNGLLDYMKNNMERDEET
jgi:hypothetical protein